MIAFIAPRPQKVKPLGCRFFLFSSRLWSWVRNFKKKAKKGRFWEESFLVNGLNSNNSYQFADEKKVWFWEGFLFFFCAALWMLLVQDRATRTKKNGRLRLNTKRGEAELWRYPCRGYCCQFRINDTTAFLDRVRHRLFHSAEILANRSRVVS